MAKYEVRVLLKPQDINIPIITADNMVNLSDQAVGISWNPEKSSKAQKFVVFFFLFLICSSSTLTNFSLISTQKSIFRVTLPGHNAKNAEKIERRNCQLIVAFFVLSTNYSFHSVHGKKQARYTDHKTERHGP